MKSSKFLPLLLGGYLLTCHSYAVILRPNLKNKSARLDALQLNAGVEDETNAIGLYLWAGNPAGLTMDEKRSRLVPTLQYSKTKDAADVTSKHTLPGIYGAFRSEKQAVAFEGSYQKIDTDILNETEKQSFGNVTYNAKPSDFLSLGGAAGYEEDTAKDDLTAETKAKSDPLYWTLGGALLAPGDNGNFAFGFQYISNDSKTTVAGFDVGKDKDSAKNFTAIFKSKNLDGGLTYVDETLKPNGGIEQSNFLVSGRLFYRPEAPWTLGANVSHSREIDGLLGADQHTLLVDTGVTWHFGTQALVGLDYARGLASYSGGDQNSETTSLGFEVPFTSFFSGRASYKYGTNDIETPTTTTRAMIDTFGLGVGVKLAEAGKLDVSWLHGTIEDTNKIIDDKTDTLEVVGTFYF